MAAVYVQVGLSFVVVAAAALVDIHGDRGGVRRVMTVRMNLLMPFIELPRASQEAMVAEASGMGDETRSSVASGSWTISLLLADVTGNVHLSANSYVARTELLTRAELFSLIS